MTSPETPVATDRHLPYHHASVTALARHLRKAVQHAAADDPPSAWNHSRWLHTLAQAAGFRNHQAWLAADISSKVIATNPMDTVAIGQKEPEIATNASSEPAPKHFAQIRYAKGSDASKPASDHALGLAQITQLAPDLDDAAKLRVLRALSHFDRKGRLLRWPSKRGLADMVLWPLVQHFDADRQYTEGEVTQRLAALNGFNDPVTLRRELINLKLLQREKDGSAYWRNTASVPDAESAALLSALNAKLSLVSPASA